MNKNIAIEIKKIRDFETKQSDRKDWENNNWKLMSEAEKSSRFSIMCAAKPFFLLAVRCCFAILLFLVLCSFSWLTEFVYSFCCMRNRDWNKKTREKSERRISSYFFFCSSSALQQWFSFFFLIYYYNFRVWQAGNGVKGERWKGSGVEWNFRNAPTLRCDISFHLWIKWVACP